MLILFRMIWIIQKWNFFRCRVIRWPARPPKFTPPGPPRGGRSIGDPCPICRIAEQEYMSEWPKIASDPIEVWPVHMQESQGMSCDKLKMLVVSVIWVHIGVQGLPSMHLLTSNRRGQGVTIVWLACDYCDPSSMGASVRTQVPSQINGEGAEGAEGAERAQRGCIECVRCYAMLIAIDLRIGIESRGWGRTAQQNSQSNHSLVCRSICRAKNHEWPAVATNWALSVSHFLSNCVLTRLSNQNRLTFARGETAGLGSQ